MSTTPYFRLRDPTCKMNMNIPLPEEGGKSPNLANYHEASCVKMQRRLLPLHYFPMGVRNLARAMPLWLAGRSLSNPNHHVRTTQPGLHLPHLQQLQEFLNVRTL